MLFSAFCFESWIGDGGCDDVNNVEGCFFDGGDCCLDDVNTEFCTDCECHGCYPGDDCAGEADIGGGGGDSGDSGDSGAEGEEGDAGIKV